MVAVANVRKGPPLPVPAAPPNSVPIATGVDLVEGDDGGVVFLWAMAARCGATGDVASRRLAAVQLVGTRSASRRAVAAAFGVNENTMWRWQRDYAAGGAAALEPRSRARRARPSCRRPRWPRSSLPGPPGHRWRPSPPRWGSRSTACPVRFVAPARPRPRRRRRAPVPRAPAPAPTWSRWPVPVPRAEERQAARAGLLAEAAPVITEGSSLPLAGALVVLPALAATRLVEAAGAIFTRARAAFYGVRSLVLAVVLAAVVGEPRAEGLTRIDPADLGRLLGLDRAPEVRTVRRRFEVLAT